MNFLTNNYYNLNKINNKLNEYKFVCLSSQLLHLKNKVLSSDKQERPQRLKK